MTARLEFGRHVRELEVDALELGDPLAELLPLARVLERFLECTLCDAKREGGDPDAPLVEGLHEVDEAPSLLANPVLRRHLDVLEDQLARVGGAPAELVLLLPRAESLHRSDLGVVADAKTLHALEVTGLLGEHEARDPLGALPRIRHRGDHEALAHTAVCDEALGAVDDVMTALSHRRGLGAAGVGAGIRLGEAEAAEHLAAREARHETALLLLGAEVHDRRGAEGRVRRDGDRVRRADACEFLDRDHEADLVESRPAELLGPRDPEQPEVGHLLHIVPGELLGVVEVARDRSDLLTGECADHLARGEVVFFEVGRVVHERRRGDGRGEMGGNTSAISTASDLEQSKVRRVGIPVATHARRVVPTDLCRAVGRGSERYPPPVHSHERGRGRTVFPRR